MSNSCWNCKYNALKLSILVPHNRTIKEYVRKTVDFLQDVVAVVKEKQDKYTVWYRSEGNTRLLDCRFVHVCMLRQEKNETDIVCLNYELEHRKKYH
jgi:hypothetical protein